MQGLIKNFDCILYSQIQMIIHMIDEINQS